MIKHSQQSKGFMPAKSGPNLSGFYMGNSSNLMQMYQTGGQTSRGAAMLARSRQRRSDIRKLEEQQRAEAKRQKKGGLFGSIGGLAGGLLGSAALGALGVSTGGLGLALAAGLGTALGKGAGERIGAGKSVDYDSSGTVYGQQSFRDIDESSEEFNKGILGRAGVAGLKAGVTAGLTPGGGIFGKARDAGGKLRAAQLAKSVPIADTGLLNMAELKTPGIDTGAVSQARSVFDPMTGSRVGALPDMQFTTEGALSGVESGLSQGLAPNIPSSLGDSNLLSGYFESLPQSMSSSGMSDVVIPLNEQASMFAGPSLASGSFFSGMEDGGFVEYGNGGSVNIQQILQDAGVTATPDQLAMFEQFDPTQLSRATEAISGSLMGMTGGQGLASAGSGFGAQTSAIAETVSGSQRSLDQQIQDQQRAFESQTLGQAASMTDQGAEFGAAYTAPPSVSSLPSGNQGDVMFNGSLYQWNPTVNQYEIVEDQDYDYSEYEDYG